MEKTLHIICSLAEERQSLEPPDTSVVAYITSRVTAAWSASACWSWGYYVLHQAVALIGMLSVFPHRTDVCLLFFCLMMMAGCQRSRSNFTFSETLWLRNSVWLVVRLRLPLAENLFFVAEPWQQVQWIGVVIARRLVQVEQVTGGSTKHDLYPSVFVFLHSYLSC